MRIVVFDGESDQPSIARFDDQDVPRKGEHVWLQGLRYFVESVEWHPGMHEVHVRLIGGMLEPEEEPRRAAGLLESLRDQVEREARR